MAQEKNIPVNKHHLLYPEHAFVGNETTLKLREFFVVKTPMYLHTQLHNELDAKHSIGLTSFQITPAFLPSQSTLDELFKAFQNDRAKKLENRTARDLLQWLDIHIPGDAAHKDCWWLIGLIRDEKEFFENHMEEMRLMG